MLLSLLFLLRAEEWVLITNSASKAAMMDKARIRDIYLGKQRFIGVQKLIPLQLSVDSALRYQFEKEVLGMTRSELHEWWIRRHYLGYRPPKVMASPEAVLAYVLKVEGSIGYVPYTMVEDENITELYLGGKLK